MGTYAPAGKTNILEQDVAVNHSKNYSYFNKRGGITVNQLNIFVENSGENVVYIQIQGGPEEEYIRGRFAEMPLRTNEIDLWEDISNIYEIYPGEVTIISVQKAVERVRIGYWVYDMPSKINIWGWFI